MSDELEKAAEEYAIRLRPQYEFEAEAILRDFKAGAQWERERAKVLVEAFNFDGIFSCAHEFYVADEDTMVCYNCKATKKQIKALATYRGEK